MKTLRASEIHAGEAIRVIAIESVCCKAHQSAGYYGLYGHIAPTALVVCADGETRVVSLDSRQSSLEELERKVPGLGTLLGEAGE